MKEAYSTSSLIEADLIKSFLEANGINCVLQDKNIATAYPAVTFYTGIKILVNDDDYKLAKEIIEDYLESDANENTSPDY